MKISIIGTGYVGLVSGVCLAEKGHDVTCVDIDQAKVDRINRGDSPIHETGLEAILRKSLGQSFRATTDLPGAILQSELSIIAVGTPFAGEEIDLRYIKEAALQIGAVLKNKSAYHTIIVKSTVVPGTTEEVVLPLLEKHSAKKPGTGFGVGMNPEFLREGEAVHDFLFPDRIVMGGIDDRTLDQLDELYRPFLGVDKIRTNPRTAETIKYAANALLATMISFSNEIANLCTAIGNVDVVEVMHGVHLDKRLSPILEGGGRIKPAFTTYLEAGCGFGGSCFPKDVKALIAHGKKSGQKMRLLDAVMEVNDRQPRTVLDLLRKRFPDVAGKRISVLGLAFKPGTDDMRESPAIPIVKELIAEHASVTVFDPVARHEAEKIFGLNGLSFAPTFAEAVRDAAAILVLTRWPEFTDLGRMLSGVADPPVIIDGRRMLDHAAFSKYEGIGLNRTLDNGEVD